MDFEDLTPDQQTKVRECETPEEILKLAQSEGHELTDEEIDRIAGGETWIKKRVFCPKCGTVGEVSSDTKHYTCRKCGYRIQ